MEGLFISGCNTAGYIHRDSNNFATAEGKLAGTLGYMSPEMVFQRGNHTGAVDVFGLGVVLYTYLAGRPLYGYGDDNIETVKMILGRW